MKKRPLKNVAASVRERLRQVQKTTGSDYQVLLTRHCIERLLFRLTASKHGKRFIVKGAILFALWQKEEAHRVTRDLDLLGFGNASVDELQSVFREVCAMPVEDDGVVFVDGSVVGEPIREEEHYVGVRITLQATVERARLPIQIDIGFGDDQAMEAEERSFPSLLGMPEPVIRAYRMETSIAEKFEAMVTRGILNSRMKDYFDIWFLSRHFEFAGDELRQAIDATFKRRGTKVPTSPPIGLTAEFWNDETRLSIWKAFWKRSVRKEPMVSLEEAGSSAAAFLLPVLRGTAAGKRWGKDGRWQDI